MTAHQNQTKVDFLNKIRSFFNSIEISFGGKTLCVCLSGGADSVALLRAAELISSEYGFSLTACHFNHMIRGEEADADEAFCKNLCKTLGVKIFCGRDDVPMFAKVNKISLEDAARRCRYAFFERILAKESVDYCLTAHNMNDNAETLLLNLVRGSGAYGASGISPLKDGVLRPLLNVTRDEIEAFLSSIDQDYVTDSTNLSNEYSRNYIRNDVLPSLKALNPSVVETLSRYIDCNRSDREYFENIVDGSMDSDLRTLEKPIRDRVIIKKCLNACNESPNFVIVAEIEKAILSDKRVILPLYNGYEAVINDGRIDFYKSAEADLLEFDPAPLNDGNNDFFNERVSINLTNNADVENIYKLSISNILSFDNIKGGIFVRNRRIGDKITIHGVNKSLKKLFIDKKIPKEYRNIIPVVMDEMGIIYVPFVGIADRVFSKNGTNLKYLNVVFNTIDKERWKNAYEKK